MSKAKYATKDINENCAKAIGYNLNISTKQAIEISNHLRKLPTVKAKKILNEAIALKNPIPIRRFTNGVGHKKGKMAQGFFAPKACKTILKIIESCEANAQYKGINTSNLTIKHICSHRGTGQWRYGRKRRQQMKSTHVEIVVEDSSTDKKPKSEKKTQTKSEKK